ncbi:potassium transport protein Kup [Lacunisphaera limnophila]|uniref:Probable potassium transport system protein Kup n=1 Tax=Lacunisphaera limnophila TaxID=1838286 RepID=A0A1D8AWY8_9BACT|nr:KUP/HAK/KT family potassium transporter [Lacunisphaera limnophila]AOS45383.1 potassium transport protein Kup [Lacunisphaera limnophila]
MSTPASPTGTAAKAGLTLGALGVVFGDIGTSPLYALRECLNYLPPVERATGVLGALSLVFWAMVLVVIGKYLCFVTRADNRGEGGIFALLSLAHGDRTGKIIGGTGALSLLILVGAALLYGDGVITPAISVLGAVEGLNTFDPSLAGKVPFISAFILAGLFAVQFKGTKAIGGIFGPAMLVWFILLGGLGVWHILGAPQVVAALNPLLGTRLLFDHPSEAAALLGSVVLAITGAEALYADMGHFGRKHIARAWYFFAFPGLILNYFGQGARVLANPGDTSHTFFAMVPEGTPRLILTLVSIGAAIIASQAMITGTFSITRQAIQLGFFPRLKINYTNPDQSGQIYLPLVNTMLALGSIYVVLSFGSSEKLVAAYGIAVTGTMVVTSLAFFFVLRRQWKWAAWQAGLLCALFLVVDVPLFASNLHKFADGGWFPVIIAAGLIAVMHTWKRGKDEIFRRIYANEITEDELCNVAGSHHIVRVRGTAVFMAGNPTGTPLVLLHHVKANKVLHETVVLLSVVTEEVPSVGDAERMEVREIGHGYGVWRVIARYGYMETPDVAALMERVGAAGVPVKLNEATYYFNREMVITGGESRMFEWQKHLYSVLSRNARPVRDYYRLPPMQIIEVGLPIQL